MEEIISELYKAEFTVVGIVSDMDKSNVNFWSELNINHNQNIYFCHPSNNSLKIFVFADVAHLLKLARNHIMDHSFNLDDGDVVNNDYFKSLLNISTTELTFAHKLTDYHLDVKGAKRQRIRPAAEVFSNSVAKAIEYCGKNGLMLKNT